MSKPDLTIFVSELLGVPKISLSGPLLNCYEQAVTGILNGFKEQRTPTLILDLAGLGATGADGLAFILRALREMGPGTCVHVVAAGAMCAVLEKAGLGAGVKTYCSLDEMSDSLVPEAEYLTSRWMAPGSEDFEIPLAA